MTNVGCLLVASVGVHPNVPWPSRLRPPSASGDGFGRYELAGDRSCMCRRQLGQHVAAAASGASGWVGTTSELGTR